MRHSNSRHLTLFLLKAKSFSSKIIKLQRHFCMKVHCINEFFKKCVGETWPFISTSLIRPLAKRREGTQHGALRLMFNNRMVGNLNQGLKPTRQNLF